MSEKNYCLHSLKSPQTVVLYFTILRFIYLTNDAKSIKQKEKTTKYKFENKFFNIIIFCYTKKYYLCVLEINYS